jgi:hypothetical protein
MVAAGIRAPQSWLSFAIIDGPNAQELRPERLGARALIGSIRDVQKEARPSGPSR